NNLSNKTLKDVEYLFVRLNYKIDKNFLKKTNKLKCIITPTTGINHIDSEEIIKKKIKLISLKGEKKFLESINTTPELTWGLALTLIRKINIAFEDVLKEKWNRDKFRGFDLNEKCCGIIGYGRIGKKISKYAKSFGMKVLVNDPINKSKNNIENVTLNKLFRSSFLIFVTASYDEKNKNMIDKKLFKLSSYCFFINTSRGELINYNDMIKYVNTTNLIGVALDVLPDEQNNKKRINFIKKIKKIKNYKNQYLITPHIGGATISSMNKTELYIAKKFLKYV
ncbi:hypothetical protein OAN10_03295, partial [Alphaproteobacteria bacterium]|nr:hypothetical protein [Alphaproteobacteria bacterium]